jgi:hypothetical protein
MTRSLGDGIRSDKGARLLLHGGLLRQGALEGLKISNVKLSDRKFARLLAVIVLAPIP